MKPKIIVMPKATPVGAQIIPDVEIAICGEKPDTIKSINGDRNYYDHQAQRMVDAMIESLPQAMIEPIIIKLMQSKISLYHGIIRSK